MNRKRRRILKQLLPVNLTPVRKPRRTTPIFTEKTGSSKIGAPSHEPSKECHTPLKTPTMVRIYFYPFVLGTKVVFYNGYVNNFISVHRYVQIGHRSIPCSPLNLLTEVI
ncbi:hypothetical protein BT93_L3818 [Corymbia citriodora subsp. variegata]|uniref:Uncharacterized protein n=1 Tax=Corymbia citriodora subsp. variegata TaxID=360336 RepID=A0A8T0CV11_CORYI|nr:hypothetical protein BT93_L3818 [Corymbia citriodora subsp. variegata]